MSARFPDAQIAGVSAEERQARQREIAAGRQIVRHVTSGRSKVLLAECLAAAEYQGADAACEWLEDLHALICQHAQLRGVREELER